MPNFKQIAVRYLFLVIWFLISSVTFAQLTAPGSKTISYTVYPSTPEVKDPVFIYCNPTGSVTGELQAVLPGGTEASDFKWFRWNNTSLSFSDVIKNDAGVTTSSVNNLTEGGYRVIISGNYNDTLTGWIDIDQPKGKASLMNRTCDYVALNGGGIGVDPFYYYDIINGKPVLLPNSVSFIWSSTPESSIPYPDFEKNPQTFNPPLQDVTYNLRISDNFGCVNESSFLYESIHVNAEFTSDPVEGEAPLEVSFTDKSVRASKKYTWDFGEKTPDGKNITWTVTNDPDSLWIFKQPFMHKYYIPGEYSVSVMIESTLGCTDSFRLAQKIVVEPSDVEIPNVFTPDGDGINDYFRPLTKSLRYIAIEVFSRSGLRVYNFIGQGEDLASWQGWDGNVNESSAKAAPGVYFYIIRAQGWDDVKYDSKAQRGYVYLYR